jgi:hypothetical protein
MTPPLDVMLVAQIQNAQFQYVRGRMQVMRTVRNDAEATHFFEAEHVQACLAPGVPNPFFNQVFISGPAEWNHIESALSLFAESGMTPRFELGPGAVSSALARQLAARGFMHTQSDPIFLFGTAPLPRSMSGVQVDRVDTAQALDVFATTYLRAWQIETWLAPTLRSYIMLWPSVPDWTLYLATQDSVPVGVGVLFNNGQVAYLADAATVPEYRQRGVQSTLISQRLSDAARSSAHIVFSRAALGTSSQRNLERAGLVSRYTVSVWTKDMTPATDP